MNDANYDEETNCLNSVNITSNVRAPGEYKYYYCGENNSSSDKSFLSFSTMWYTTKIPEEKFLLSSCYNELNTAFIYYCPIKGLYNIYVYKNDIDYKSENISLKPIQLIHLEPIYKPKDIIISKNDSNGMPMINITVKIYFGADNYLLLNEVDKRIILIDFFNGNFITLFSSKETKSQEPVYNIIDTFDESYFSYGEEKYRTYVFLSIRYQEKKLFYFKYRFFIIERDIIENNYFFLHQIDLDLGNGEPLGLKIARITKMKTSKNEEIDDKDSDKDEKMNHQWFFIFCFLSSTRFFELVTNYNRLSLYQVLRIINQCQTTKVENGKVKSNKSSITIIGYHKIKQKENDINESVDNDIDNERIQVTIKPFFWSTSIILWLEKKQVAQSVKLFLNLNTKRLCALILFFEMGEVASFPFNYNDSPEEIKNKITITLGEIQLDKICPTSFGEMAKVYQFEEKHYFFKSNTICALSYKYLVLSIDNNIRIYDLETNKNLLKYSFYKERINSFMLFNNLGFTFMMTWTKIFKIIFTTRLQIFSEKNIINESKTPINVYEPNGLNYPLFENSPEDIWKSYYTNLELDSLDKERNAVRNNTVKTASENKNEDEKEEIVHICEICSKKAEYCCSDCELKYYCSQEHFMYDYNNIHFFECQLVQFFKRRDIINRQNREERYLILYNELIKLCGRILNYMFTRIFVAKDCHLYLEMLLGLITLLDNFGFNINYSEFCSVNLFPTNDKQRPEKVLFFQECIYYYAQLQILKCTFTSKSKLYNLTDCYLKIIKNDVIPKLTPKTNKRIIALRCDKLKKKNILNNPFFKRFESSIFFNLKKTYYNSEFLEAFDSKKFYYIENNDTFDIIENYLMKHLMALSILVKFKIKLNSSIDVKDIFVDITLMFDYHFRENKTTKNIVSYCYFFIAFYLVEIGKVPQSVKLLKKMVSSFNEKTDNKLKALTYYNLGILQYALGEFKIGIHNLEISYKQFVDYSLSEKFKQTAMISLGLAYLNQPNLFKAYVLIQKLINDLKKIKKQKNELKCIKLCVYLNYIIDLYEYSFITKSRIQTNKSKNKLYNSRQLVAFVEGGTDKELIVIEQHISEFLKVVEYIWNLKPQVLQHLQTDNPPKQTNNYREEVHHEKNSSFSMETSQMSTFLMRETGIEKEESQEEYDEDIEVKPSLYDSLTRQQQKDFKELKTAFLKRDIILRDSLGIIEKFNINYDPLYSPQFQKIIEKLKSNFLLKEIFYCFQNEKWRDELYNYSPNNVLFGLSKYLKLEKIKNVIAIEKSKCLDKIKNEKNEKDNFDIFPLLYKETDTLKKINTENSIYPNNMSNLYLNNSSFSLNAVNNRNKTENLNYIEFKKKFMEALKDNDKNKKKFNETNPYFNLKEDYLVNLYKNVYLNDPEHDFIFQNPSLILNYIFIDISNSGDNIKKEENDLILKQKLEEENESNNFGFKRTRKISNTDKIKSDESFKIKNKILQKSYLENKSKKDLNDVFGDKGQLIITPFLENMQEKNENLESSSESIRTIDYSFCYLKFEEKDLIIVSKEIEYIYNYKDRKRASSMKKFKKLKRKRTEILDIYKNNYHGKYSLDYENDEGELDTNKQNKIKKKNISFNIKRDKSSTNLRSNVKLIENETSEELDENNIKKLKKDIYEKVNKTHFDNSKYDYQLDDTENPELDEKNESISKKEITNEEGIKDNIDNNKSIDEKINKKEEENKKEIINNNEENLIQPNKNEEMKNSQISTQNSKKNYFDMKYFDFLKEERNPEPIKKTKTLNKNKSVKQFNKFNNNNKKKKVLERTKSQIQIPTKKTTVLIKPKTYNFFTPKELRQEMISNNKQNKRNIERIGNKNYGFKNKTEQEIELVNGAIEYLKNEINNNRNINDNGAYGSIQKKYYQLYENNNQIKNRNKNIPKYKEKKGDESTMSLTSTSIEILYNKNKNSIYSGDISTNNDNSSSSQRFQKEMTRIINYNKKLITDEKNNGNVIKHNKIIFNNLKQNLNNNKIYNNKRMKKSFSQVNLYGKKLDKTENEKTAYSKNKTRSNKYSSPIDNQKSIYYFNNKSINNNNSKNSSNLTKLNDNNTNKFRFVLDKYIINQRNTRNNNNKNKKTINKNKKEEEKSRNNIENEKQSLKMPKNSGINKYDFDKKENSKMISTKKNDENILSSNYENNRKKEQTSETFFNDTNNIKFIRESENIIKNSNETNNLQENDRVDTLCNDLGSNFNIKELINLPFYITPKYSNNESNIDSLNKMNDSSNSNRNDSSFLKNKPKYK